MILIKLKNIYTQNGITNTNLNTLMISEFCRDIIYKNGILVHGIKLYTCNWGKQRKDDKEKDGHAVALTKMYWHRSIYFPKHTLHSYSQPWVKSTDFFPFIYNFWIYILTKFTLSAQFLLRHSRCFITKGPSKIF